VRAALVALLVAGCSTTVVEVSVEVRAGIAGLTQLEAIARNDGDIATATFDIADRGFPVTFTVTPEGRSGEIEIELRARDATGVIRAGALATAAINDGGSVSLALRLDPADFLVNTVTAGSQRPVFRPGRNGRQIAAVAGGFAVAFENDCQDPATCDVFVRRFDANGQPVELTGGITEEIAANVGDYNLVSVPGLAGLAGGELAVTWELSDAVMLAVLGPDGGTILADTEIDDPVAIDDPVDPAVSPLSGGNAAVSWYQERDGTAVPPLPAGIWHAVYQREANTLGAPVLIQDAVDSETPALAELGNGELGVLFAQGTDLRLSVGGAGEGPRTVPTLRSYEGGQVRSPSVVAAGDDRVTATWTLRQPGEADFDPAGLMIGTFGIDGSVSAERLLVGPVPGGSDAAGLAVDGDGRVAAVWHNCGGRGDGDGCGIFLQVFSPELEPLAPPHRVNTTTADDQLAPSVAAIDGGFAVVWTDLSGEPPDSDSAVRARPVYLDALIP
jgi:hypothetical protein